MATKKKDGPEPTDTVEQHVQSRAARGPDPVVSYDAGQALYRDRSGPARTTVMTEGVGYRDTMAQLARDAAAAGAAQEEESHGR